MRPDGYMEPMGKIRLSRNMAAVCFLLLSVAALFAGAPLKRALAADQSSLKEAEREKNLLEQELSSVQQTIEDLKGKKGDITEKVAELNQMLMQISARITALEDQLVKKSAEIEETQLQLADAVQREQQQYEDMKVRIQFMYENSQTSYLQVLLSSKNIAEFMNASEYISGIESYDRQKLQEYEQTVQETDELKSRLETEHRELEEMKASVEEDKEKVAAMMRQKETELSALSEEIKNAQSEADYYAAEIQAQEELIAEIRRAEAAAMKAANEKAASYNGGAFVWPCPASTRVTSDFGARVSPTSGASTNHMGIDVGAPYGADIVAAAAGTVRSVNYSSAAGNYVMIDHGGGVYTVYMHASSVNVSKGQTVSAGEVIAKVGSTGISTGNHLHFGVSQNGSYVSPWGYFGG